MSANLPATFTAIRLHSRTPQGWAVIRRSTGAIVVDDDGKLVMGLTSENATTLAAEMSAFAAEANQEQPAATLAPETRKLAP